jgi:hypothetical protein
MTCSKHLTSTPCLRAPTLLLLPACLLACSPLSSPDTILAIIILCVYAGDVALNFFVAFYQDGELVTQLPAIAANYARWRLWVDLVRDMWLLVAVSVAKVVR